MTSASPKPQTYTAFESSRRITSGFLPQVTRAARDLIRENPQASILVFDDETGQLIELDWREPSLESHAGPGRPKLGVVAREVTLLPRHWEWLSEQPGGASVALRKLVEDARRSHADDHRRRSAREAVYKFLTAMAGNEPGFEEALRALYRGDQKRFNSLIKAWPGDIPRYAKSLATEAF